MSASDSRRPLVSIGFVVHNGERFLGAAIRSILEQTYRRIELIISDNASTDGTQQICEAFAATDRRIRYVRQPSDIGPARNFLFVLEEARGDFFMWAAHDDLRERESIERLLEALEKNPRAVLASSAFDNIDYENCVVRGYGIDWSTVFSGSKWRQFARLIHLDEVGSQKANHIYGLIRRAQLREALTAASFVDTYSGNDNCVLLELLGRGDFEILPEVLFHYRVAPPTPTRRQLGTSESGGLFGYLWRRAVGRSAGHGGNFLTYLRRTNEYFDGIWVVVRRTRSLGSLGRVYLQGLVMVRKFTRPVRTIIASARHEL